MIIKKLIMHNFGVYSSTNVLEFVSDKPVVLVGGMNGRGKTTILEAVLLSLYGSNSFAYTESKYNTYGQYLKSYVNKTDGSLETYLEIEFLMDDRDKEVYNVRRGWDGKGIYVHERIIVKKNGEESAFLTENWPMFVENILPSALSSFFFFDGEKIAELAVEETSKQMKESIKAMLGITVLDVLQSDVSKIIARLCKANEENQDLKKLEELRSKKENAEQVLRDADSDIEIQKTELEQLQLELEKLNTEYVVKGGGILEQKNKLISQRAEYIASVSGCQEQLLDLVAAELPLALVSDLLIDIAREGKLAHEKKINTIAFEKIKAAYSKFSSQSEEISKFISFMQIETEMDSAEETYSLSDMNLFQVETLNSNGIDQSVEKARSLIAKRDSHQRKIDEIDNSLSVDIDDDSLEKFFALIKEKEREIIEKQITIDNLQKERTSLHGNFLSAESEFSKFAEKTLAMLETVDDDKRTIKYANMAIEIIKLYRIRLQERKTDVLAQTMTECYKRLANKKNLVNQIKMDADTLNLHYIDGNGEEIAKKRLSAGEKQLMVISLLWALAICSKKKLPVIIDTPLSRLDSAHREALIKTYFPNASEQTIILSTDSEIDEKYYLMMKDSVGDEYTLNYCDRTRTTTIKPGYFGWKGILK
ncbi:MAG: DNA sulfur modification protein DndD [Lachnospiraceae bacterium]